MLPQYKISKKEIRIFEVIPGLLVWLAFALPLIGIFIFPNIISYIIILFEIYWFFRSIGISKNLIVGYRRLQKELRVDWLKKLKNSNIDFESIHHVIIIPAYNEGKEILQPSLDALTKLEYDLKKIWVVLTVEERGGKEIDTISKELESSYQHFFGKFFRITHPDGIPGEAKAKGANITYAAKIVEKEIEAEGLDFKKVLISSIDSDAAMHPQLIAHFTYTFLTTSSPHQRLFQFIPLYHNNFWDAPSFSRIIAMGCSFWSMIESTREYRLRTFACYGMSWLNLKEAEYWDVKSIIEDGVQYWRNIFAQKSKVQFVQPVYSVVYMDAVLDDTLWGTMKAQYKQLRRWAWGASDLAYITPYFRRMKDFSFREKFQYIGLLIENHFTWATVPLLLLFSGQLPLLNRTFSETVFGGNIPSYTSWILTATLSGLFATIYISLILLPKLTKKKRKKSSFLRYILHIFSFIFVPIITIVYGALPSLHSQTQLMLGKRMESFVVTVKKRK